MDTYINIKINSNNKEKVDKAFKKAEDLFETYLMTYGLPKIDLMIRTSGEQRLSNFLLWQLAYTEMIFTSTYWPDFNSKELKKCILEYQKRDRRYGNAK